MKKLIFLTLIIASAIFNGCDLATFDKPQPADVGSLLAFPQDLQGKYLSGDQASTLTITDKLITRHYKYEIKENKHNIDSSYKLTGDTLINIEDSTKEKIIIQGDTIIQHADWTDTLFNITYGVLKKFKGYYFINNHYNENAWNVKRLSLKNGMLTLGIISSEDDLKKLRAITNNVTDTSTYFTPTQKQFKKFLKQKGFEEQEVFYHIKETQLYPQQHFL